MSIETRITEIEKKIAAEKIIDDAIEHVILAVSTVDKAQKRHLAALAAELQEKAFRLMPTWRNVVISKQESDEINQLVTELLQ